MLIMRLSLLVTALGIVSACSSGTTSDASRSTASLQEVSQFAKKASLLFQLDYVASQEMIRVMAQAKESGDPSQAVSTARKTADGFHELQALEAPAGFEASGQAAVNYAQHAEESFAREADALENLDSADLQSAVGAINNDSKYAAALLIAFKADLHKSRFSAAEQRMLLKRLKG